MRWVREQPIKRRSSPAAVETHAPWSAQQPAVVNEPRSGLGERRHRRCLRLPNAERRRGLAARRGFPRTEQERSEMRAENLDTDQIVGSHRLEAAPPHGRLPCVPTKTVGPGGKRKAVQLGLVVSRHGDYRERVRFPASSGPARSGIRPARLIPSGRAVLDSRTRPATRRRPGPPRPVPPPDPEPGRYCRLRTPRGACRPPERQRSGCFARLPP